jgi:hypothetical protein
VRRKASNGCDPFNIQEATMKTGYAILPLLLLTVPATAASTKSDNGVDFTCELSGSNDSGFNIVATNKNATSMDCTASCKLIKADGSSKEWDYNSPARTVGSNKQKYWFAGESSVTGSPLKNPDMTKASCKVRKQT